MPKLKASPALARIVNAQSKAAMTTSEPFVGMPATYCIGSDRYAGMIAEVCGRTKLVFVFNKPDAIYNPKARRETARLSKRGEWNVTGSTAYLHLGVSEDFRDPCF